MDSCWMSHFLDHFLQKFWIQKSGGSSWKLLSSTALNLDGKSPCRADIPNPKTPAVRRCHRKDIPSGPLWALEIGKASNKKNSRYGIEMDVRFSLESTSPCNHSATFGSIIRTRCRDAISRKIWRGVFF